jgi:hypothetical protein
MESNLVEISFPNSLYPSIFSCSTADRLKPYLSESLARPDLGIAIILGKDIKTFNREDLYSMTYLVVLDEKKWLVTKIRFGI